MIIILAVASLTSAVTLRCTFMDITWLVVERQYTCINPIITDDGILTHVVITGEHRTGKSNADVKGFIIGKSDLPFTRIPEGIGNYFPNLLGFQWVNANFPTLIADDLKLFPHLQVLAFFHNKIVSLDSDLFKYTPKLRFFNFGSNLLENVGCKILDGLNDLTNAYFDGNPGVPGINVRATTPEAIQELRLNLQSQCATTSSSTSTTLTPITSTTLTTTELPMTNSTVTETKSTTLISTSTESASTTISSTTESGHCPIGCVELINILDEEILRQNSENLRQDAEILKQNEEIARIRNENASQADEIAKQIKETNDLRAVIARQGDAIVELEKQIREIWVRP